MPVPETSFRLRWPDGSVLDCYSPSLVVHEHLPVGTVLPVVDLLPVARVALTEASERVRARYGFPCSRALAALSTIESFGAGFPADGPVVVEEPA